MHEPLPTNQNEAIDDFNLKEEIFSYLIYWKWFLVGISICFFSVFVYLRYYIVEYNAVSTILIKDEKKGGTSELSAFSELNIFSGKSSVENEIAILKSRKLSQNVIDKLNLDITYFSQGRVISKELYDSTPYKLVFIQKSERYPKIDTVFTITKINNKEFLLSNAENKNAVKHSFGQAINSSLGQFFIVNENIKFIKKSEAIIVIKTSLKNLASNYSSKLIITNVDKTNVLNLSINDAVSKKGIDFLDELVNQFNLDATKDRNQVAENTSKFIKDRLEIITKELGGVEDNAEFYKKNNDLTDNEAVVKYNF